MTDRLMQQLEREAAPVVAIPHDPGFRPAARWTRAYRRLAAASAARVPVRLALARPDGTVFHHAVEILPWEAASAAATTYFLERTLKFLLWQKGGSAVSLAGCPEAAAALAAHYGPQGARAFDAELIGRRAFRAEGITVAAVREAELPPPHEPQWSMGGNWNGCRIGFDLGGSDRKCAAVIDGRVVHTEEVPWSPVTTADWHYHLDGIEDSLKRAAAHLPRVDAIGGSSAGIYVNNEVRIASLFRAIPVAEFDRHVRRLFIELGQRWKVPLEVINDGEVTALAGALAMQDQPVLGVAMGTSLAGGYSPPQGGLTTWLNELAFVPIDFRQQESPRDEWSGDVGCGVQYLTQQGVGRLTALAGLRFADGIGLPERLAETQRRLAAGDAAARDVFTAVGRCLGYAVAHFHDFYALKHLLVLGRVTSGEAGSILVAEAEGVLRAEFPELLPTVRIAVPDETQKRHGQAVVAASLPRVK